MFIEQRATPLSPLTQKTLTIEATKKSGAVTTMTFLQETIERAELLAAVFKAPLGTVCLEAGWQPGRLAAVLPGHLCPPPPPLAWQPATPPRAPTTWVPHTAGQQHPPPGGGQRGEAAQVRQRRHVGSGAEGGPGGGQIPRGGLGGQGFGLGNKACQRIFLRIDMQKISGKISKKIFLVFSFKRSFPNILRRNFPTYTIFALFILY